MSVVIQSLTHNPLIRNYFLRDGHSAAKCTDSVCTVCTFRDVFHQMYMPFSISQRAHSATRFLEVMWKAQKRMAGVGHQDAHEFLISLLNQMHANLVTGNPKNCRCTIHQIFSGQLQSTIACFGCFHKRVSQEAMMDLCLQLDPLKSQNTLEYCLEA